MLTIENFIQNNLINYNWLITFFLSMLPLIESKIAIPFSLNKEIWQEHTLSCFTAFSIGLLGNIFPSYFIIKLLKYIKKKKKVNNHFSNLLYSKSITNHLSKVNNNNFMKYINLTLFVAIPLPLTGVWSASIIAGLSNLDIRYSMLSIIIGSIISCSITLILSIIFIDKITIYIVIFIILILIFSFYNLLNKKKKLY